MRIQDVQLHVFGNDVVNITLRLQYDVYKEKSTQGNI